MMKPTLSLCRLSHRLAPLSLVELEVLLFVVLFLAEGENLVLEGIDRGDPVSNRDGR